MDYFQCIISNDFYLLDYFQWVISNGLFPMDYFQWIISNAMRCYSLTFLEWKQQHYRTLTHLTLESQFTQPIEINFVHHNIVSCKCPVVKGCINHISLKSLSVKTFKQVKSVQKYFRTVVTKELYIFALQPMRVGYSLSQATGSLEETLDAFD